MIWVGVFFLVGGVGMIVNPGAIAPGRRGGGKVAVVGKGLLCVILGVVIMALA
jgi:hypothetical protein